MTSKPDNMSWREYLSLGVRYLEGASKLDFPKRERRRYEDARIIFGDCMEQKADNAVRAEAAFRLAQCSMYQQNREQVMEAVHSAEEIQGGLAANLLLSSEEEAQCLLLKAYCYAFLDLHQTAGDCLLYAERLLNKLDSPNRKLYGDMLNLKCRFVTKGILSEKPQALLPLLATHLIDQAIGAFKEAGEEPLTKHALASALSRGADLHLQKAKAYRREAEKLLQHEVRDINLTLRYYRWRLKHGPRRFSALLKLVKSWIFR